MAAEVVAVEAAAGAGVEAEVGTVEGVDVGGGADTGTWACC